MRHLMFSPAIALAALATMPRGVAVMPLAAAKDGAKAKPGAAATKSSAAPTVAGAAPEGLEDNLTGASSSDMEASGAFMEPEIKDRIDTDHPAVDNNPRAGQPAISNQIDFNDPTKSDAQAVADNLNAQGVKTKGEATADNQTGQAAR